MTTLFCARSFLNLINANFSLKLASAQHPVSRTCCGIQKIIKIWHYKIKKSNKQLFDGEYIKFDTGIESLYAYEDEDEFEDYTISDVPETIH